MLARKVFSMPVALAVVAAACAAGSSTIAYAQSAVPTSTLLSVKSSGALVNRVPKQTSVQLVAQVQSSTAPLTTGQVRFCDASAPRCTDLHLLGVAQLTPSGTATLSIVPGPGSRAYRAEFLGVVKQFQPSVSSNEMLTVNGKFPTKTTLVATGSPGNYTLTATVVGTGSAAALTGNVFFTDLTTSQPQPTQLGVSSLGSSTPGLSLIVAPNSVNLPANYTVGDFNDDGIPDLAGVGLNNSVGVVLGDGTGGFPVRAVNFPVGYSVNTFAVGDFNGDGFQDIAATSYTDAKLIILLGEGDGTFQTAVAYPGVAYTNTIAVGDFNRDGIADLATTSNGVSAVSLFIGQGDGTFRRKVAPLASAAISLVVADVNGDSIQDLAAAEDNSIEVLLGSAGATFTSAGLTAVANATQMIGGDFNADGKVDLAVASQVNYAVSVLLGNGNGSFTAAASIPFDGATQPNALALTDLNQDGLEDIAVATSSTYEGIGYQTVLFGTGQGTFTSTILPLAKPYAGGQYYASILSADMNGDGNPDLLVGPGVLLDKPTQTAQAVLTGVSVTGPGTHSVQAASSPAAPYNPSTSSTAQLQGQ
ncbi:FG-GAP repeat protein [Terriglobus roseus DSM 18391]|uniref:FG-GAP repeat protein n=1 Tax=Terriglobus roseus (strain DSM 18391 / NRRL B-41598 / KBS 63) TaxID=926566 RepID=I3ZJH2_TERRK|nr:VCBS repeat-containing protein [Terriglobus roseus]AFL89390.1 FG-GAP repeat protein [Terriglobus roseus DSM 18391]